MTDRNLFEADLAGERGQPPFVVVEPPAVDQDDGDRPKPGCSCGRQIQARPVLVQRSVQGSLGPHPLVDLNDPVIELVIQHDVAGEQVRPALPADAQGVAEAARDSEDDRFTLALQQGIGGHGRAHTDFGNKAAGQGAGRGTEDPTDAFDRSVGVLFGIVR